MLTPAEWQLLGQNWSGSEPNSIRSHLTPSANTLTILDAIGFYRTGKAKMPRYDPKRIEPKWQRYWDQNQTFATPDAAPGRKKLYVLDMFPYPSGDGLHVGHPEGYTATDIICRLQPHARQAGLAPDGMGCVRSARRAARCQNGDAPARDDLQEHRYVSPPVEDARLQLRLGAGVLDHRSGLFPLDAVDLSGPV